LLAIDKRRIHATIPIHTVTHEAPVVHQSQVHDPVPIETFVKAHGAVPQSAITKKVLQGQNSRHVDGVAEELERDLNLGKNVSFFFFCVWFRGLCFDHFMM
jgi:hypothetical protein